MNPVVHFEIGGTDVDRAATFYAALFGWTIAEGPARMIDGAGITGHLNALGHEPHNYTVVYVSVADIQAHLAKAETLGATRVVGPITIPAGQFAWLRDPTGTVVGLWQAA